MSTIDEKINEALSADDKAFLEGLEDERGLFRQLGDTFHGPMKGWTIAVNLVVVALTLLGFWAVWGFLNADSVESMLRWAGLGWIVWTVQIAAKQWLWDRINLVTTLRELKRIELRLALLENDGQRT